MRTFLATIAVAVATLAAPFPAQAADTQETASAYAFQWSPGCLAVHTGRGIDGYNIDGLVYDVPDRKRARTYLIDMPFGVQDEQYETTPLAGFTASVGYWLEVQPGTIDPTTGKQRGCAQTGIVKADGTVKPLRRFPRTVTPAN